jgi:hypothetical protein
MPNTEGRGLAGVKALFNAKARFVMQNVKPIALAFRVAVFQGFLLERRVSGRTFRFGCSFDAISASHVLEYLPNIEAVFGFAVRSRVMGYWLRRYRTCQR